MAAGLLLGLIAYGLSLVLYLRAMRELGAARTAAYFGLAPFAGAAIAVIAFTEPVTVRLVAAGALMAWGIWLHVTERHEHEHDHGAIEHEHRHVHDEHHKHAHAPDDPSGEPHSPPHQHEPMTHRHPACAGPSSPARPRPRGLAGPFHVKPRTGNDGFGVE
jgi:hypothetical protein